MDASEVELERAAIDVEREVACELKQIREARLVVDRVCSDLSVGWAERDVTLSAADLAAYGEMIPVVFVDGAVHGFWRVDESRMRAALT